MAKLIFGCGYLGQRVGQRRLSAGAEVAVVTRSHQRAKLLAAEGFVPLVADVTLADSLVNLPTFDIVLYAIGYDRASGATMRQVYVDGLRAALDALAKSMGKMIYISSTGVYGQSAGEWVDERSLCEPTTESGRVCLEAEQLLAQHRWKNHAITLRMAGIYGPGRVPNLSAIRAGEPIAVAAEGWLNLIHVDDAAAVVLAVESQVAGPGTYVVSDGEPVRRQDYYRELARLGGAPPPIFIAPAADAPVAQRAASSKRIDTARLRSEVSVEFRYPTYREGLAAIIAADVH